jgi:hypothetical protein
MLCGAIGHLPNNNLNENKFLQNNLYLSAIFFRFGSKAEVARRAQHFRSTLKSRHRWAAPACPFGAMNRHAACYSITSSARTSKEAGTVRPNPLAAFMLITRARPCAGLFLFKGAPGE